MTKYILAGGNEYAYPAFGVGLSNEIQKANPYPRVLGCFFAKEKVRWVEMGEEMREWLQKNMETMAGFEIALPESFHEQINRNDVIYLYGGDTPVLIDTLKALGVNGRMFDGKTVIGSSAGANVLAKNAWSSRTQRPRKGLGIVDVNIMVHYGAETVGEVHRLAEDWEDEERQFRSAVGGEPIMRIPEGEFIVIEG